MYFFDINSFFLFCRNMYLIFFYFSKEIDINTVSSLFGTELSHVNMNEVGNSWPRHPWNRIYHKPQLEGNYSSSQSFEVPTIQINDRHQSFQFHRCLFRFWLSLYLLVNFFYCHVLLDHIYISFNLLCHA